MKSPNPVFQNQSVLLAEDNPTNQFAVSQLLKPANINLEIAADGAAVIKVLERREDICLVLMDVEMPGMDGIAATREIRKRWPERELPIIALTASSDEVDQRRCREAGMCAVLTKPIRRQDLMEALQLWLAPSSDLADASDDFSVRASREDESPELAGVNVEEALNRLGLPWEVLRDMLRELGTAFPERLKRLDAAMAGHDLETMRRQAHSIAGAAGSAGANDLHRSAKRLERAIKAGEGDLSTLLGVVHRDMEIVMGSIRSLGGKTGAGTVADSNVKNSRGGVAGECDGI